MKRAVIGEIAMIPQIESVHLAISMGKIPDAWKGKSYASLKPLGSYVNDLMARLQFLQSWIDNGEPAVYWFSGFYFTQSFITGILQNHSRKHKLQIDLVTIQFNVTQFESDVRESSEVGVFVRVSLGASCFHFNNFLSERFSLPRINNLRVKILLRLM